MSDSNEFVIDETTAQEPGKLRQMLEQALASLKQKDRELAAFQSKEAERLLGTTWNELQVPDAIRKLYQGEKTADAIKAWWEDSKALFNIEAAAETKVETPEQTELASQIQAVQQAANLGTDAASGGYSAALAKAQEIKGKSGAVQQTDLDAFFRSAGIPTH